MRVSVVIPTYNRAKSVRETVRALCRQDFSEGFELIVVDDGSSDRTGNEVLSTRPDSESVEIRYFYQDNGGPASARNLGVRKAEGEFVAFTDSDCLPAKDWLKNLLQEFDESKVAGVGGITKTAVRGFLGDYVDAAGFLCPRRGVGGVLYLVTANACFRRRPLVEAGLFDEAFRRPGGEDDELCVRIQELGYELKASRAPIVFHTHRRTIIGLLKSMFTYGEGRCLMGAKWPQKQIDRPERLFLRLLFRGPSPINRSRRYEKHGPVRSLCFSWLDYLRELAFLSGYIYAKHHA